MASKATTSNTNTKPQNDEFAAFKEPVPLDDMAQGTILDNKQVKNKATRNVNAVQGIEIVQAKTVSVENKEGVTQNTKGGYVAPKEGATQTERKPPLGKDGKPLVDKNGKPIMGGELDWGIDEEIVDRQMDCKPILGKDGKPLIDKNNRPIMDCRPIEFLNAEKRENEPDPTAFMQLKNSLVS